MFLEQEFPEIDQELFITTPLIITFQTAWYACEYLMNKENAISN